MTDIIYPIGYFNNDSEFMIIVMYNEPIPDEHFE